MVLLPHIQHVSPYFASLHYQLHSVWQTVHGIMPSEQMNNIPLEDNPSQTSVLISPSRQLTLESQRGLVSSSSHAFRRFYSRLFSSPRDLSPFEEEIKHKAEVHDNKEDLSQFLSDFRRLKSRSGARISECLVWYKSFADNTTRPPAECKY